jgi:hypothetical protein
MKNPLVLSCIVSGLAIAGLTQGHAQGTVTFIFDQQSATESTGGGSAVVIQANQPLGQSFTPSLSSVGFIRLALSDPTFNSLGATFVVNLRDGSITGNILGTSDSVTMPDRFAGYVDFFFATPVSITPGTQYYFQPSLGSGDASWTIRSYNAYAYSGGTAYNNGIAAPGFDLWFREGIIVPEPSSGALLMLGLCAIAARRRWSS